MNSGRYMDPCRLVKFGSPRDLLMDCNLLAGW